jgi:hypothetical protein
MKTQLKKVVSAYKALGEAKVSKLDEKDVIKVVKARKAMRPIADDYEAFLKDCQEKFKPEDWDAIQEKIQKWQQEGDNTTLTEAERIDLNKAVIGYQSKIEKAVKDELDKEVDLNIDSLSEEASTKLLVENGWELKKLDDIEIVL